MIQQGRMRSMNHHHRLTPAVSLDSRPSQPDADRQAGVSHGLRTGTGGSPLLVNCIHICYLERCALGSA